MSRRFEVRIRGRKVISCTTHDEAQHWADLLGTDYAPSTIHDTAATPVASPPTTVQQPSIFDHLEDPTP